MTLNRIGRQLKLDVATGTTHKICGPHLTNGRYVLPEGEERTCKSPSCKSLIHAGLSLCLDCAETQGKCQLCAGKFTASLA